MWLLIFLHRLISWLISNWEAWTRLILLIQHGPILKFYVARREPMFKEALGLLGCWSWLPAAWKNTVPSSSGSLKVNINLLSSCALIKAGWSRLLGIFLLRKVSSGGLRGFLSHTEKSHAQMCGCLWMTHTETNSKVTCPQ